MSENARVFLKPGTVVHVCGIPVRIESGATACTALSNVALIARALADKSATNAVDGGMEIVKISPVRDEATSGDCAGTQSEPANHEARTGPEREGR